MHYHTILASLAVASLHMMNATPVSTRQDSLAAPRAPAEALREFPSSYSPGEVIGAQQFEDDTNFNRAMQQSLNERVTASSHEENEYRRVMDESLNDGNPSSNYDPDLAEALALSLQMPTAENEYQRLLKDDSSAIKTAKSQRFLSDFRTLMLLIHDSFEEMETRDDQFELAIYTSMQAVLDSGNLDGMVDELDITETDSDEEEEYDGPEEVFEDEHDAITHRTPFVDGENGDEIFSMQRERRNMAKKIFNRIHAFMRRNREKEVNFLQPTGIIV
jgi:hypothetical protein